MIMMGICLQPYGVFLPDRMSKVKRFMDIKFHIKMVFSHFCMEQNHPYEHLHILSLYEYESYGQICPSQSKTSICGQRSPSSWLPGPKRTLEAPASQDATG